MTTPWLIALAAGCSALAEWIQGPVYDQSGTGRLVVGWALNDAADYFFPDGSPLLSLSHHIGRQAAVPHLNGFGDQFTASRELID